MTCPDTRIQPEEPPPPARATYAGPAASFFAKGCLNCKHCDDGEAPHKPEQWVCLRRVAIPLLCFDVRNDPSLCALQARWFKDAITGR